MFFFCLLKSQKWEFWERGDDDEHLQAVLVRSWQEVASVFEAVQLVKIDDIVKVDDLKVSRKVKKISKNILYLQIMFLFLTNDWSRKKH